MATFLIGNHSDRSSPLICSIKQAKLDADTIPDYEAISYTWGQPVFSHQLFCDDGSIFPITQNLESALARFRLSDRSRYLWADLVSINQSDLAEKSSQIALMARIYQNAARVLVWLGNDEGTGSIAMALLGRLSRINSISWGYTDGQYKEEVITNAVSKAGSPNSQDLELVWTFIGLPWFSRRWIIQEVTLNPDIILHCGSAELSWIRFVLALEVSARGLDDSIPRPAAFGSVVKMIQLWRNWSLLDGTQEGCGLLELLDAFHHFDCSDQRDRLFALAGLATDVRAGPYDTTAKHFSNAEKRKERTSKTMTINADYSLSVNEVYCMFALERLTSSKGGLVATVTDASERRVLYSQEHILPSWVPDLRSRNRRHAERASRETEYGFDCLPFDLQCHNGTTLTFGVDIRAT
ncbi:HET-domain-containing protein [Microthyrium microscopicum]|uniref:HET-domain-containing protein n=1 Tax=Microthyrium microscopicum TaxID=703497 RepID=A0A6A6UL26_9PEZI|nr:HET-domain-containing protein [Microthyrium microscopicum]